MEFARFDRHQASETKFEGAAAFLAELDRADRPGWPLRSGPELAQTADLVYMAAINRALGYRELSQSVYIEADIDAIEAVLASEA